MNQHMTSEDHMSDDSEQLDSIDTGTGETVPTFGLALGTEFTFHASIRSPAPTVDFHLKCSKGHPDGPTPTNSSQKKRTCTTVENVDNLPSPLLLFPLSSTEPSYATDDVFGPKTTDTKSSGVTPPEPGTLFSFWKQESKDSRIERDKQDFEELVKCREKQELEEERTKAMQKDRQRVGKRERQQRHRDKIQEIRVANG
jgi:hypothetical protein